MKQAEEWILIDFINKNGDMISQQLHFLHFTTQLVVFFIDKSGGSDLMGRGWGATSEVLHREQSVGSPEGRDGQMARIFEVSMSVLSL